MEVDFKVHFAERYFDKSLCQYDIHYVDLVLNTRVNNQRKRSIPPFEGVGGVIGDADGSSAQETAQVVGNASERCKADSQRLETLATTADGSPATKVPPFEGVGGVTWDADISSAEAGNESVPLSQKDRVTGGADGSSAQVQTFQNPPKTLMGNDTNSLTPLLYIEAKDHLTYGSDPWQRALAQIILTNKKQSRILDKVALIYRNDHNDDCLDLIDCSDNSIMYNNDIYWQKEKPNNPSFDTVHRIYDRIQNKITSYKNREISELYKQLQSGQGAKIHISLTNFNVVYNEWCNTIRFTNREVRDEQDKINLFLVDLLNGTRYEQSVKQSLMGTEVTLDTKLIREGTDLNKYTISHDPTILTYNDREIYKIEDEGLYNSFWSKYVRPPQREEFLRIVEQSSRLYTDAYRRDTGGFYTPESFVRLQNEKLAELGYNMDEYIVCDPCCGVGNLENQFGKDYKAYCYLSTLEAMDVDICKIKGFDNVVQFDFLKETWDAGNGNRSTGGAGIPPAKTQSVLSDNYENAVSQATRSVNAGEDAHAPTTGDESVSLSQGTSWGADGSSAQGTAQVVDNASERCKADSQRLETLATTAGEPPANPTTGDESVSLSKTHSVLQTTLSSTAFPKWLYHGEYHTINEICRFENRKLMVIMNPPYVKQKGYKNNLAIEFFLKVLAWQPDVIVFYYMTDSFLRDEIKHYIRSGYKITSHVLTNAKTAFQVSEWPASQVIFDRHRGEDINPADLPVERYEIKQNEMVYIKTYHYNNTRPYLIDEIEKKMRDDMQGAEIGLWSYLNSTLNITNKGKQTSYKITTKNLVWCLLSAGINFNTHHKYFERNDYVYRGCVEDIPRELFTDSIAFSQFYKKFAFTNKGGYKNYLMPFGAELLGCNPNALNVLHIERGIFENPPTLLKGGNLNDFKGLKDLKVGDGSGSATGDESVSLSQGTSRGADGSSAQEIAQVVGNASERCKADSQRLETLATTAGEPPANQTTSGSAGVPSANPTTFIAGETSANPTDTLRPMKLPLPPQKGDTASPPCDGDTTTVPPFKGDKGDFAWSAGSSFFDFRRWLQQFDFSPEAQALFQAALKIFRWYHQNPRFAKTRDWNDSWYDITNAIMGKDDSSFQTLDDEEDTRFLYKVRTTKGTRGFGRNTIKSAVALEDLPMFYHFFDVRDTLARKINKELFDADLLLWERENIY